MKTKRFGKSLSCILCMVLIAAVALLASGCSEKKTLKNDSAGTTIPVESGSVLGQGAVQFTFVIVDKDGTETTVQVHTDEKIVGKALLNLGLIEGEDGPYGMYTKKVNGISADYDKDGVYWAFYEGDSYAMKGVDQTEIVPGATYAFKVEK